MHSRTLTLLATLGVIAACGKRADSAQADANSSSAPDECSILAPADIKAVTAADVHPVARGSSPGAGGTCANYATADSEMYLGVNDLRSRADYKMAVGSVPRDVYPLREAIANLGDEAILMQDETKHVRYLVARKGDRGVVLFPLGAGMPDISNEQLRQLAERALSAKF